MALIFLLFVICIDKALKEKLEELLLSGYFDQVPSQQNGVCGEEEEGGEAEGGKQEEVQVEVPAATLGRETAAQSSEAEEQPVDAGSV